MFAGEGDPDAVRQPLAERSGGDVHPGQFGCRVPFEAAAEPAVLGHQLLVRDDADGPVDRVEQWRGVALGEDQVIVVRLRRAGPSRSGDGGHQHRHQSAADMLDVGCPEPARVLVRIESTRSCSASWPAMVRSMSVTSETYPRDTHMTPNGSNRRDPMAIQRRRWVPFADGRETGGYDTQRHHRRAAAGATFHRVRQAPYALVCSTRWLSASPFRPW